MVLRTFYCAAFAVIFGSFSVPATEAGKAEIRIGGFAEPDKDSAAAIVARVTSAYFSRVNQRGGISGRSVHLISYDAAGDRRKALDLTRKLYEVDHVALLLNLDRKIIQAAAPYLRFRQIPQMYEAQDDLTDADVTTLKARTLGEYIHETKPDAKIAVLHETGNSTAALDAFYEGLGPGRARRMITNMLGSDEWSGNRVARVSGSSADILAVFGDRAFQSETVSETVGLEWKPVLAITDAVGIALSKGAISAMIHARPIELTDDETVRWQRFKGNLEPGDAASEFAIEGFLEGQSLTRILKQCDADLSSDCLRQTYASEKDYRTERIYDGSVMRFDGSSWHEPPSTDAKTAKHAQ